MDHADRTEQNCDLLFEYLRSILYDTEIQQLEVARLDEPFQKLGLGLQYLARAVTEMKDYSAAIAKGDLSAPAPGKDNFLCENLKGISANLRHLTWQAKQVAKGDYSQKVSFLGEFSEAFNTMTDQLRQREQTMQAENRQEQDKLKQQAFVDALTQIGNRACFDYYIQKLLAEGTQLLLCYCDLDGLKYINDCFGHAEGNFYLRTFAALTRHTIRDGDLFARMGGDEFCLVLQNCPKQSGAEKMRRVQEAFAQAAPEKPYSLGFSFGLVELPADHGTVDLEALLRQADHEMYLQKRERKMLRQQV